MKLMSQMKTAAAKHVAFTRTYRELRRMPRDTAIDLGMFPEDAYRVAHQHVYGC